LHSPQSVLIEDSLVIKTELSIRMLFWLNDDDGGARRESVEKAAEKGLGANPPP
jgi:hypothetical protein